MTKQQQPTLAQKQNIIDRLADREYTATTTATAQTAYDVQFKITQSQLDDIYDGDFQAWLSDCESGGGQDTPDCADPIAVDIDGKDGPLEYGFSISVQNDQGVDICKYYDGQIDQDFRDQNGWQPGCAVL